MQVLDLFPAYDDRRTFSENFAFGRGTEKWVGGLLNRQGCSVMETGQIVPKTVVGGPTIAAPMRNILVTDLFVWRGALARWIEVKHKTCFAWNRNNKRWVTGIDLHLYRHYQDIENNSPWPVWLFFQHDGGYAKGSGFRHSPFGLFADSLQHLMANEFQQSDLWGPSGMVYWEIESLEPFDEQAHESLRRFNLGRYKAPAPVALPEQPQYEPQSLAFEVPDAG